MKKPMLILIVCLLFLIYGCSSFTLEEYIEDALALEDAPAIEDAPYIIAHDHYMHIFCVACTNYQVSGDFIWVFGTHYRTNGKTWAKVGASSTKYVVRGHLKITDRG